MENCVSEGVGLDLILTGYDSAYKRLSEGRTKAIESGDSRQLYVPLLETLGWADVIEEWMTKNYGQDWVKELPGCAEDLEQVIIGFRFARNVVHHRWALAVELDDLPENIKDWRWKKELKSERPQPRNELAYTQALAGRALRHTFKELHRLYNAAVSLVARD